MRPRHRVAARVETEEEQDQTERQSKSARKVHALDLALVRLLDRHVDEDPSKDPGDGDEWDLDVERPAPIESIVHEASEDTSDTHTGSEEEVHVSLPQTSLA